MKRICLHVVLWFWAVCFLTPASIWAGQIITEETRAWAHKAVQKEKRFHAQPAPNTVAVLYFENKTGKPEFDSLEKGLTLMLITDLAKVKEIDVLERVKVQAIMDELDLGRSGILAKEKAPRVGRLLGVANLVGGDINIISKHMHQLKARLLKISSESVFGQPEADGKLLEGFFLMQKDLLFQIIRYFKIELAPEERKGLSAHITNSLRALIDFFKGIDRSDRGDYDEARKFYMDALKADPEFELASAALQELNMLDDEQCKALRNKLLETIRRR